MFGSPLRRTVSMYLIVFVSFKLAVDVSKCITHIKLYKNQVQNEPYFIGYWVKVSREVHFYLKFGKKRQKQTKNYQSFMAINWTL